MPNKPNTGAANKAALKERIKSMLTMPPMATDAPADPNTATLPPVGPGPAPAPARQMYGPNLPSYYEPIDRQEQVGRDLRNVAVYEGGRYRGMNNEEVEPGNPSYIYSDTPGVYYEKPTKIVRKGKYASKQ